MYDGYMGYDGYNWMNDRYMWMYDGYIVVYVDV